VACWEERIAIPLVLWTPCSGVGWGAFEPAVKGGKAARPWRTSWRLHHRSTRWGTTAPHEEEETLRRGLSEWYKYSQCAEPRCDGWLGGRSGQAAAARAADPRQQQN
jgi:hypothetical protein